MIYRMTGIDATLWHLERPHVSPQVMAATLVHGLAGESQALVVCSHVGRWQP